MRKVTYPAKCGTGIDPSPSTRTCTRVIAISGTSGAGKSTLIDALCDRLGAAIRLSFDDYVTLGTDPEVIGEWLASGVDPDRVRTPHLARDLRTLRAGESIVSPTGVPLAPARVILIEEPFGRARAEMSPLIDWAIHLDVPLDVALARRLLRSTDPEDIAAQLRAFLGGGRDVYLAVDRLARGTADRVFDGMIPAAELASGVTSDLEGETT